MVGDIAAAIELLPGEDPSTRYPADICLWIGVYAELVQTVDRLRWRVPDPGSERAPLDVHAERLRRRLAYWRARATELANGAAVISDGTR